MIIVRNWMRRRPKIELLELASFGAYSIIRQLFDCSIVQLFGTPRGVFGWVTGAGGSRYSYLIQILCYDSS